MGKKTEYSTNEPLPNGAPGYHAESYPRVASPKSQPVKAATDKLRRPEKTISVPEAMVILAEDLTDNESLQLFKQIDRTSAIRLPSAPARFYADGTPNPAFPAWQKKVESMLQPTAGQLRPRYSNNDVQLERYNGSSFEPLSPARTTRSIHSHYMSPAEYAKARQNVNDYSAQRRIEAQRKAAAVNKKYQDVNKYSTKGVNGYDSDTVTFNRESANAMFDDVFPSGTPGHRSEQSSQYVGASGAQEQSAMPVPKTLAQQQWEQVEVEHIGMVKRLGELLSRLDEKPRPGGKQRRIPAEFIKTNSYSLEIGTHQQIKVSLNFLKQPNGKPKPEFKVVNNITGATQTFNSDVSAKAAIITMWQNPEVQLVEAGKNSPQAATEATAVINKQTELTNKLRVTKDATFILADKWANGTATQTDYNNLKHNLNSLSAQAKHARAQMPLIKSTVVGDLTEQHKESFRQLHNELVRTNEDNLQSALAIIGKAPESTAIQRMIGILQSQASTDEHNSILQKLQASAKIHISKRM